MAEETDIETQLAANATGPQSVSVDGTSTTEFSLPDQIAADKYLRANRARRRPGLGVIFRKILPPGAS